MTQGDHRSCDPLMINIFETNLIGICLLKSIENSESRVIDFEFLRANGKAEELLNTKELTGKMFTEVFPAFSASKLFAGLLHVAKSGEQFNFDFFFSTQGQNFSWRVEASMTGDNCLLMFKDMSGVRLAEIIQTSQDQLRALMDNNPSLVFMKDEEGKYVYVNETYKKNFLHTSDWFGKTDYDFWPRESAELFRRNDTEVLRSGNTIQFVEDSFDLSGRRYCWLNYKFPFKDSDGRMYVGGIGIDTTERVKAEESLRISEEKFRNIFESMLVQVALISMDGSFIDINQASLQLHGAGRKEDLIGENFFSFIDPDYQALAAEKWEEVIVNGSVQNIELVLKNVKGEKVDVLVNVTCLKDETGKPISFLAMSQDITQRKNAERENARLIKELQESRELYKELVTNARSIIIRIDKEGKIVFMNEFGLDLFGFKRDEIIGRTAVETIVPRRETTGRDLNEMAKELYDDPDKFSVNINENIKKNGERVWIEWYNKALFDNEGNRKGHLAIGIDITENKRAREVLETEQKLIRMNEELQRSNRDLQQFAYVASHDLQEPLRMIASFTQLLQQRYKDKLDDDANDYINYAVSGAKRMYELLNGILTFSRVNTRGQEFRETDMNEIMKKVRANLHLLIGDSGAKIICRKLPVLTADETQMIQLLQNLIENAIKFSKEKPLITVSTYQEDGFNVISVKDNGIGISPEYHERIFRIFQRLHSTEYKGTGIGLAISKRIVDRHRGSIWVDSKPGKGSVFSFRIPLRK